jgi:hypothetical protein
MRMAQVDPHHDADQLSGNSPSGSVSHSGLPATLESHLPALPTQGWNYGPPPRPEILTAKANPAELLHALRRRWALATGLGLATGLSVAALLWYLMPVKYEVYALLRVQGKTPSVLKGGNEGIEEFNIFKRTQVQTVISPLVLEPTASEPAVAKLQTIREQERPANWLKRQLIIDFPDDAELMRVTLKGRKPEELKIIIDKVVDKYMKEVVFGEKEKKLEQEAKLAASYEEYTKKLEYQMRAVHALEKLNKVSSSEVAVVAKQVAAENLQDAFAERRDLRRKKREIEHKIMLEKAREEHGLKTAADDQPDNPTLWLLEKEKGLLQNELNEAEREINEDASAMASLDSFSAEVTNKQQELTRLRALTNELGAKMDSIRVERMALDRISPLYKATIESDNATRRLITVAVLALCGVALIAAGVWPRVSRGQPHDKAQV